VKGVNIVMTSDSLPLPVVLEGLRTICHGLSIVALATGMLAFLKGSLEDKIAWQRLGLQALFSGIVIAAFPTVFSLMYADDTRVVRVPSLQIGWLDIAAVVCFAVAAAMYWQRHQTRREIASDSPNG
jgi:hypothetical protein